MTHWIMNCKTEGCTEYGIDALFVSETSETPIVVCGRCDTQYPNITEIIEG